MIQLASRLRCFLYCIAFGAASLCARSSESDTSTTPGTRMKQPPRPAARPYKKASTAATPNTDSTAVDSTASGSGVRVGRGGVSVSLGAAFNFEPGSFSLSYGKATLQVPDVWIPFQSLDELEFRLGGLSTTALKRTPSVAKADCDDLYVQMARSDIVSGLNSSLHRASAWRGGFSLGSGYAYMRDSTRPDWAFIHSGGLCWQSLHTEVAQSGTIAADKNDRQIVQELKGGFATHSGFSIHYGLSSTIGVQLCYERNMIFQGFSFSNWLGSLTLEGLCQLALSSTLIKRIEAKSPVSVPLAALVLRSAVSYGFYELRRSSQHFPFGGAEPLMSDALRLGLTFAF